MQRRMRLQRRTEASVQSARQSRGLLHTGCSLQGAHTDTDTQTHRHTQTHTQTHTDTQTHTQHCTVVLLECTKGFVWFHSMLVCIFVCFAVVDISSKHDKSQNNSFEKCRCKAPM